MPTLPRPAAKPDPPLRAKGKQNKTTTILNESMKQRIYISGPMSNVPREEYLHKFSKAEQALLNFYPQVTNPARLAPCRHPWLYRIIGYRKTLAWDLAALRHCTHIFMMTGWQQSRGARLEHRKAREWGIKIIYEQENNTIV